MQKIVADWLVCLRACTCLSSPCENRAIVVKSAKRYSARDFHTHRPSLCLTPLPTSTPRHKTLLGISDLLFLHLHSRWTTYIPHAHTRCFRCPRYPRFRCCSARLRLSSQRRSIRAAPAISCARSSRNPTLIHLLRRSCRPIMFNSYLRRLSVATSI